MPAICLLGWMAMRRNVLFGTDLGLYDETSALAAGARFLHAGTLTLAPAASPLFSLWHALWLSLTRDPVSSYYVQWLATDLLLLLAVLATARTLGLGRWAAGAAALVWASTTVAAVGWPRVYLFALLVLLVGHLFSRAIGRGWPGGLALGLAAFVRPEFQLSALLWCALFAHGRIPSRYRRPLALLTVATVLVLAVTVPWGGGRMWLAFSQHVSLRFAETHPGALTDPWLQAPEVSARLFPGAHTVSAALHLAPHTVLTHVLRNLVEYPVVLLASVANWPHAGFPMATLPGRCLLLAAALAVIVRSVRRWRGARAEDRPPMLDLRSGDKRFFVSAAGAVIPSLLVMPKATYAVLFVLALVLVSLAATAWVWQTWGLPKVRGASVLPGLALAGLAAGLWLFPAAPAQPRGFLRTTLGLQRVWAAQPAGTAWRMLEADGGWCVYLDIVRCTTVTHTLKAPELPLSRLIEEQRINAILVTSRLAGTAAFRDDPEFRAFTTNPAAAGFALAFSNGWASLFLSGQLPAPRPAPPVLHGR